MTLYDAIRQIIKESGKGMGTISEEAGYSYGVLSSIMRGDNHIRNKTLLDMLESLGYRVEIKLIKTK